MRFQLDSKQNIAEVAKIHEARVLSLLNLLQDVTETLAIIDKTYKDKEVYSAKQMQELLLYVATNSADIIQLHSKYVKKINNR